MPRIAVGVEYLGSAYSGWQRQAQAPSIQESLQAALAKIADAAVNVTGAGRTDAGVHACGQVAHFDTAAERSTRGWLLGANTHLPADINLCWVQRVPAHFHARYSAQARSYRYFIVNRQARSALAADRAWHVHAPLDATAMQTAADLLVGVHDFSAFRSADCQARSPIRRLDTLSVERCGNAVAITVTANAFLHHMVRNLVGVLVEVGRGDALPERAARQLASRQRATGAPTAPACGLYFWEVHYPHEFGLPQGANKDSAKGSAMILPS